MKILLADDESLVRSTMKSMLADLNMPIHIVGEARNGEELLQLVKQHSPDLVFVDIRMPKLNGLEAIAAGKSLSPHTRWVILTGYSEFDYAKEAIRLKAADYLLKPVTPAELQDCILNALEQCRGRLLASNLEYEFGISSILLNTISIADKHTSGDYDSLHYEAIVLYTDACTLEDRVSWQRQFLEELQPSVKQHVVSGRLQIAALTLHNGCLAMIPAWHADNGNRRPDVLPMLEQQISQAARREFHIRCRVVMLKSGICCGLKKLQELLADLQTAAPLRTLLPADRIWYLKELHLNGYMQKLPDIGLSLEQLYASFQNKDYMGYVKELNSLEKKLLPNRSLSDKMQEAATEYLNVIFGGWLDPSVSWEEWLNSLKASGELIFAASSEERQSPDLVQQVVRFIDNNYMHDIGIGQIAAELRVTPNYLSSLFHKKQGTTFVKYLTKIRMLKAKELLLTKNGMKVQQVAEAVGYYSTRHFTKLFTDCYGCYPSELREQITMK